MISKWLTSQQILLNVNTYCGMAASPQTLSFYTFLYLLRRHIDNVPTQGMGGHGRWKVGRAQ